MNNPPVKRKERSGSEVRDLHISKKRTKKCLASNSELNYFSATTPLITPFTDAHLAISKYAIAMRTFQITETKCKIILPEISETEARSMLELLVEFYAENEEENHKRLSDDIKNPTLTQQKSITALEFLLEGYMPSQVANYLNLPYQQITDLHRKNFIP
jgi:hypothetical protein